MRSVMVFAIGKLKMKEGEESGRSRTPSLKTSGALRLSALQDMLQMEVLEVRCGYKKMRAPAQKPHVNLAPDNPGALEFFNISEMHQLEGEPFLKCLSEFRII
jgi:hypothetical protein